MKKIFVINGSARSGKDTFVEVVRIWNLTNTNPFNGHTVYNISSVDNVKKAAKMLGWNGTKDDKGRKFLSDLKYLSSETYDGPFKYMRMCIEGRNNGVFFLHVREPSEIKNWVRHFPETKTIFIKRDTEEVPNNRADQEVDLYDYDYYFENNETLELYVKKVHSWCGETFK